MDGCWRGKLGFPFFILFYFTYDIIIMNYVRNNISPSYHGVFFFLFFVFYFYFLQESQRAVRFDGERQFFLACRRRAPIFVDLPPGSPTSLPSAPFARRRICASTCRPTWNSFLPADWSSRWPGKARHTRHKGRSV